MPSDKGKAIANTRSFARVIGIPEPNDTERKRVEEELNAALLAIQDWVVRLTSGEEGVLDCMDLHAYHLEQVLLACRPGSAVLAEQVMHCRERRALMDRLLSDHDSRIKPELLFRRPKRKLLARERAARLLEAVASHIRRPKYRSRA